MWKEDHESLTTYVRSSCCSRSTHANSQCDIAGVDGSDESESCQEIWVLITAPTSYQSELHKCSHALATHVNPCFCICLPVVPGSIGNVTADRTHFHPHKSTPIPAPRCTLSHIHLCQVCPGTPIKLFPVSHWSTLADITQQADNFWLIEIHNNKIKWVE